MQIELLTEQESSTSASLYVKNVFISIFFYGRQSIAQATFKRAHLDMYE